MAYKIEKQAFNVKFDHSDKVQLNEIIEKCKKRCEDSAQIPFALSDLKSHLINFFEKILVLDENEIPF